MVQEPYLLGETRYTRATIGSGRDDNSKWFHGLIRFDVLALNELIIERWEISRQYPK